MSNSEDKNMLNEFLTFSLGQEEYGIDILKVQEIRNYEKPTQVANAPSYIKGLINLRGVIVPIIDLRMKFNLPKTDYSEFTVVIILNLPKQIVGIIVDSVSEVITLEAEQMRPAPELSDNTMDTRYLVGLGSLENRMLLLIDIEHLVTTHDLMLMHSNNYAA